MAAKSQLIVKCFNQKINTFSSLGDFKSILHKQNLTICVGNWPGNSNRSSWIWKTVKAVLTPPSCEDGIYSMFEERHFQRWTSSSVPTFNLLLLSVNHSECSSLSTLGFKYNFLLLLWGTELAFPYLRPQVGLHCITYTKKLPWVTGKLNFKTLPLLRPSTPLLR